MIQLLVADFARRGQVNMTSEDPDNKGHDTSDPARTYVDQTDATWVCAPGGLSDLEDPDADKTIAPGAAATNASAPGVSQDPGATCASSSDTYVGDVWGDTVDGQTPGQTLKPGDPKATSRARAAPAPKPPDLSSKGYELLDVLGEGGVGIVYQAVQTSVDRQIAVKMIKPGLRSAAGEHRKFVAEAMVTGKLDHPNIVPIHDLDTTADGNPFYTMKMVRGTPWSKVIRDKTLSENLSVLLNVCDGVSFAHARSVVHRDLKPENVMLGAYGEVQLMDWGLGAPIDEAGNVTGLEPSQQAGGTPLYMAPEMVTGEDGPVGVHSDVYLLGAILFEIVTGEPPHPGSRVLEVLENARDNVVRPTEHSGPLVDIALKAMETAREDRYPSATAFRQALIGYQTHAESIGLTQRSAAQLDRARNIQDYDLFAQALFGYREAMTLWSENADAQLGISQTQFHYGQCAYRKGDLDLASSLLDRMEPTHAKLLTDVEMAQQRRDAARRRLRLFRIVAITLTASVVVILTVASIWIYAAKQEEEAAKVEAIAAKEEAVASREVAVASQKAEAEQRQLAEQAKHKAEAEEARAVKALDDLQQAYADLVEAQEQERQARARAAESEQVAAETRDELAKTGMLRDNTWWVFDRATAEQKQRSAAETIGMPEVLDIPLPGDASLTMKLIPPGEFVMGSPPEETGRAADEHLHRVRIGQTFYMGAFELTETQWQAVLGTPPPSAVDRDADAALPVVGVSAEQIATILLPALQAYAPKGYTFRLPTEAQWEYACRAGTGTAFHSGDAQADLTSVAWFLANSDHESQPVGRKGPNAFGLYDMHGNVSEVCLDHYAHGFYLESPVDDPVSTGLGDTPVVRGGSALNTGKHCRSAYRSYVYSKNEYPFLGLRLVLFPETDTAP